MRNIGIRIQRYKLQRYRPPETISEKARLGLAVALGLWAIWALFLSDQSALRLLGLTHKRNATEEKLAQVQAEVKRATVEVRTIDDPDVIQRILRERHNFAHEGELLYVIQRDGTVGALRDLPAAGADSTGR